MASSSDVLKKVLRLKVQLAGTADPATVIKYLEKLKDLDITLDILAETGIGKTVNSLRRHEQAGEFAKSLVKGWKKLVPKEPTNNTEDGNVSESLSAKDRLHDQKCLVSSGSLTMEDLNNNCLTSHSKSQESSDDALFKTRDRKGDSDKQQCEEQESKRDHSEVSKKMPIQEGKLDDSVSKKKKNDHSDRKSRDGDTLHGNKHSEITQKSRSNYREMMKSTCEKESIKKSKSSKESSKEGKESFLFGSKMLKLNVKGESLEAQSRKRKKSSRERNEHNQESENKKAKIKPKDMEHDSEQQQPSMSFESYLNYDVNVFKRRERRVVKKPSHKIKNDIKDEAAKEPGLKSYKSLVMSLHATSPKQKSQASVMDLMNIPLPAVLPECEKPFSVEYFEKTVDKESDFCDVSEESAVFTGQRLNRKMQVYSGAKTIFLPAMMSLYQQCIRTLQNNINLLYETGGVPFEILEPVLERCTPEQLLRIEECNPIYIGVTDHLWGKHCQRDFKDSKLQEYESWKEMYIRLSEERERKLQRLTKSIVSAHSKKPKGRQVKMAFIHTVAKPPRDVRIQQEIHGTAVQQPHQLKCSVKAQDNRLRQSCNELSRSSSTSSGATNMQDPRKKTSKLTRRLEMQCCYISATFQTGLSSLVVSI
ncbi:elongin A, like isoform X2 [Anabas testudineus]|uniref:elongin A, like isoform X2 n=1 Tax=Anabas testudineus TaxID=64144 RepID=UPI000E45CF6A|nr:elongin A, like isoform X2 [Anabas testudineus]